MTELPANACRAMPRRMASFWHSHSEALCQRTTAHQSPARCPPPCGSTNGSGRAARSPLPRDRGCSGRCCRYRWHRCVCRADKFAKLAPDRSPFDIGSLSRGRCLHAYGTTSDLRAVLHAPSPLHPDAVALARRSVQRGMLTYRRRSRQNIFSATQTLTVGPSARLSIHVQ